MKDFGRWMAEQAAPVETKPEPPTIEVDEEELPYGLKGGDGKYYYECRGCGKDCDWEHPVKDFDYDYAYGGCSEWCIP